MSDEEDVVGNSEDPWKFYSGVVFYRVDESLNCEASQFDKIIMETDVVLSYENHNRAEILVRNFWRDMCPSGDLIDYAFGDTYTAFQLRRSPRNDFTIPDAEIQNFLEGIEHYVLKNFIPENSDDEIPVFTFRVNIGEYKQESEFLDSLYVDFMDASDLEKLRSIIERQSIEIRGLRASTVELNTYLDKKNSDISDLKQKAKNSMPKVRKTTYPSDNWNNMSPF